MLLVGCLLAGCAGAQQSEDDAGDGTQGAGAHAEGVSINLAPADASIRTIQLYGGEDERALPILPLGGAQQLTLAFDLMEPTGRPLSVYFYHADRTWRRDLSPVEYLTGFQSDNLLDYTPSRGTDVDYVHYAYRFPNEEIGFALSGNYVVRVTEQGREEEVLFERAFFVTEQRGGLALALDNVMVSGQRLSSERPVARYTPPSGVSESVFDYTTCFVQNGAYEAPRCTDQPRLAAQPTLLFDLPPSQAFGPQAAAYVLDLGTLQVGGQVESTDRAASPPAVTLEPDYARFAGADRGDLFVGQVLVEEVVRDVAEPAVSAEYARVRFSFVPPEEQPLYGDVWLLGAFGSGAAAPADTLRWVPARGRYEGTVLVKQGRYAYRYASPDPALERVVQRALPRLDNRYLAFVYYRDVSRGTDRLLAVQGAVAP